MLTRKTQLTQNKVLSNNKSSDSTSHSQHGLLLLHIPLESLTHITSNLDPKSLLALAQVNLRLSDHIRDDHTWHRAFVCQYLGMGPETDLHDAKFLLLRRSHVGSWRQEFILYYSLRRRWERSRNTTTAHIPLHSAVSSMHLMPSHGLISSSLQYGVVSRSLPFTGRVLRGYLDAAGSGTGLGIGNPNTEFTPNVSACALGADGGTAKVAWGFRNGEVSFTAANKAMDTNSRSAAKFSRCTVGDKHQGMVLDIVWDAGNVVTGGSDGTVKVWDPKRAQCVWTSDARIQDQCVKVAAALNRGIVAGAMRDGNIIIWSGFTADSSTSVITVPCPVGDGAKHEICGLHIDGYGPSPTLLVTFSDHIFFYRVDIDLTTGTVECAKFGDSALGAITALTPFFTNEAGEHSLVIAGTQLGCVGVYDWTIPCNPLPAYKLEAYEDGAAVTALAWNGLSLVTGCARGTTKVWDALTLEHVRTFPSPIPRKRGLASALLGGPAENPAVRQIVLGPEKDVLLVAVGDRVMAWRAGPVPKTGFRTRSTAGKKERSGDPASKSHQHLEMRQAIVESRHLLEDESKHAQRVYGREREQRAQLEALGLDEVEAVEYLLMLSREEAIERERSAIDQGVFEGEFDISAAPPACSPPSSAPSSPPRVSAVSSNAKIRVSSPFRAEPTEALLEPPSPELRDTPPAATEAHFPLISGSVSAQGSAAGSPARSSAWSLPLARSLAPSSTRSTKTADDEMDDDLRLAIALSLSEAGMK
ncbi:WD40-repeat-containing domain protein [Mycena pura]|uniref:WD40-repeat-containing domain protein n=1 Tax=Mycena pura TaxID=153505 RepID=A0AAD6YIZ1_9AGAR|nr:WD40-repeat-containing domain protein [Mycena pura]